MPVRYDQGEDKMDNRGVLNQQQSLTYRGVETAGVPE